MWLEGYVAHFKIDDEDDEKEPRFTIIWSTQKTFGTKFGRWFYIRLDFRDSFTRSLLSENGYFIVFYIFAQFSNLSYTLPSEYYATKSSRKCIYLYF